MLRRSLGGELDLLLLELTLKLVRVAVDHELVVQDRVDSWRVLPELLELRDRRRPVVGRKCCVAVSRWHFIVAFDISIHVSSAFPFPVWAKRQADCL